MKPLFLTAHYDDLETCAGGTAERYGGTSLVFHPREAHGTEKEALSVDAKLVSIEQPHIWYNVYEATKMAARRMLTGMHYDEGLRVEFVTAHNAYGPGQAYGGGHPQKIIPTFATKAWTGEPIPIWGDGSQMVNLVYAGDVADMLVSRALAPTSLPLETYNAGSNEIFSVMQVVSMVDEAAHGTASVERLPMRRGEQPTGYPQPDETYPYRFDPNMLRATVESYRPNSLEL